jgi:mannitol-1-/sugar-/sorbitol-6-/2-deoxyglucose-6-phosphatase
LVAPAAAATAAVVTDRHSRAAGRVEAVIFDMDGLLVDTEPIWRSVHAEVFGELGLDLARWPGIVTTGMRVDEVSDITKRVASLVPERARLCPGAVEAIRWCREHGLHLGMATGSLWPVVEAVLASFDFGAELDVVVSAEDERFGKPHPAVYLTAATKLGAPPTQCLVFEDAVNGIVAAKAARMRVVVVPSGYSLGDPRVVLADLELGSLLEIDDGRVALLAGL